MFKILLLVLSVFVVSCNPVANRLNNDTATDKFTLRINPKKIKEISFLEHYSEVTIIPLQTNAESVIKEANKIRKWENRFYILDIQQSILLIFDSSGIYIDKIARKGTGPGEYSQLYDFDINRFTGNIELLNPWGKLMIYSPSLEFIESLVINQKVIHQFFNMNRDTIVFYTGSEPQKLSFYSRSQNLIFHKDFAMDDIEMLNLYPTTSYNNAFQEYEGSVLFQIPYSNTVYDITNCDLKPHLKWDFGEYNFEPGDLEKGKNEQYYISYYAKLRDQVFSFFYFYETEKRIFTKYVFNDSLHTLTYNRETDDYDIVIQYSESIACTSMSTSVVNDEFFRIANLNQGHVDKYSAVLNKDQIKTLSSIRAEDNPVIIKYRIK